MPPRAAAPTSTILVGSSKGGKTKLFDGWPVWGPPHDKRGPHVQRSDYPRRYKGECSLWTGVGVLRGSGVPMARPSIGGVPWSGTLSHMVKS